MVNLAIIAVKASSHIGFRTPLIKALAARGVTVFALASDFDEASREYICSIGAEPVDIGMSRIGMNPLTDLFDTIRLTRTLKDLKPDIVLGSFIKPVIFGTLAAWVAGVPKRIAMIEGLGFVYTGNGAAPSLKIRSLRAIVSTLYRFALKRAPCDFS